MRIDSSGRVGIGTSSPGSELHVAGQIEVTTDTTTPSGGSAYFYKSAAGATVSGYNAVIETGSLGSRSERMRIDYSGNLLFNSGYGSVATAYGCRAWVNFNGTGTVAIRASGNVSSITDNNTGLYTVNLATAMPDANGSVVAFAYKSSATDGQYRYSATGFNTILAGSFGIHTGTTQVDNALDAPVVTAAVFR
jgi:hypothetical protein